MQRMESQLHIAITRWLEDLPQPDDQTLFDEPEPDLAPQPPAKKRKIHYRSIHLPSPDRSTASSTDNTKPFSRASVAGRMTPETPGKRKAGEIVTIDDETPRPTKIASNASSIPDLSSQSSQRSGRSSPVKNFPIQGIGTHSLTCRTLNPNQRDMPPALLTLLGEIADIEMCWGFIPAYLQPEIAKRSQSDRSLQRLRPFAYIPSDDSSVEPQDPASAPGLLSAVESIVDQAGRCQTLGFDETGWNHLVHSPLLHAALNEKWWPGNSLTEYSPCMNASVTARFHRFLIPSTKVDYVLHINPALDLDASADAAVQQLRDSVVENSINHTAFDPLRSYPICLSIETKKYGGDLKKADLQLCSWQAAQWTLLSDQAGDAISRLPFLPGIIVQGHEWKFVVTTRKNEETTLWASASFGSTMTSLGVLQIMAGLSRLRGWSTEVFWPWYKEYVLHIT
ncbi:hypothetical protein CEP52_013833 [Fusarium oligoseptatum]|uniref:PD-(D/E)XK nuclease-like domain-containing protein n=1 Tax=Fusarium oligoseptatum TaxID=2604345 RepID=A0A428SRL3_9HYPO|nr:hypothetical protein CEP52_013833 [Fusarium oligoseptatum]